MLALRTVTYCTENEETPRPRGGRLIEAYSAKLQRRIRLFDHLCFAQWIRLEADPTTITFCERPVRLGPERDARVVDFWVEALSGEEFLLLEPGHSESVPARLDDMEIRTVVPAELAAARTPLEAVALSVRRRGAMLNWLPEAKRRTLCLMQTPRRATVRGYLHQGQRPHINFFGIRYTSSLLASSATYLGQTLRIYYNSHDLRTVRAFGSDGVEIGALKAQGAWGEVLHDLKLRQEILRMRGRKQANAAMSDEFLETFVRSKLLTAKSSRRAASDAVRTLRTLAWQPPAPSEHLPSAAGANSGIEASIAGEAPAEPERLTIGSGFVGAM